MSTSRKWIVGAGVAAGLAVWWGVALVMSALSDIALLEFGRSSGYDANAERAALYWAPMIGVLFGGAVIALGFALVKGSDPVDAGS